MSRGLNIDFANLNTSIVEVDVPVRSNFNTREFDCRRTNQCFLHKLLPWRLVAVAGTGIDSPRRPGAFYTLKNEIRTDYKQFFGGKLLEHIDNFHEY